MDTALTGLFILVAEFRSLSANAFNLSTLILSSFCFSANMAYIYCDLRALSTFWTASWLLKTDGRAGSRFYLISILFSSSSYVTRFNEVPSLSFRLLRGAALTSIFLFDSSISIFLAFCSRSRNWSHSSLVFNDFSLSFLTARARMFINFWSFCSSLSFFAA